MEGRLQSRSWDAPDGTKRSTIEVVAQGVQFLSRSPRAGGGEVPGEGDQTSYEEPQMPEAGASSKGSISVSKAEMQPDEEVPF